MNKADALRVVDGSLGGEGGFELLLSLQRMHFLYLYGLFIESCGAIVLNFAAGSTRSILINNVGGIFDIN